MHFGKAIKKKMIDKDRGNTWMASQLGITRQAVHAMCSKPNINTKQLHKVCRVLETTEMEMLILAGDS